MLWEAERAKLALCGLAALAVALASLPAGAVTPTEPPLREGAPNHPPSAQAGPPIVVVDGGPHDEDDRRDGEADFRVYGGRSSDVDDYWNETHCRFPVSWTGGWPLEYDWYEKGQRDGPIAGGYAPILSSRSFGFQAFTLEVSDHCDATDTDSVQAFVATSKTELARWTFADGHSSAWSTQGAGHVTEACEVDADGAYLAFTLGPDGTGACTYRADDPVHGTATLSADPRNADVLALEFSTRFDTREGIGSLDEELFGDVREDVLAVEASFDGGATWTQANHTFSYDRMDEDLDDRWHRAGGIYNLSERDVTAEEILFRFTFDSVTAPEGAEGYGWLVDDVRITSLTT